MEPIGFDVKESLGSHNTDYESRSYMKGDLEIVGQRLQTLEEGISNERHALMRMYESS